MRRLDLVVGCNGAGKSTFVQYALSSIVPGSVFVNAHVIAQERWPHDPVGHSYDAAKVAEQTRAQLIKLGESFIAETVFSHPSKISLIREAFAADYFVALHVLMIPEELAVARVAQRVGDGGHHVPEHKIRGRYQRLWDNVITAIELSDESAVYDNSSNFHGPRAVARMHAGVGIDSPVWPRWAPKALTARSPAS